MSRRRDPLAAAPRPPVIAVGPDGLARYAQGADPAPRPPKPSDPIVLRLPRAALDVILSALDERGTPADQIVSDAIRSSKGIRR